METDFPTASVGSSQAPTAAVEKSQSASKHRNPDTPLRLGGQVRRVLIRFERISAVHYALKTLAYTMINLRHFCRA